MIANRGIWWWIKSIASEKNAGDTRQPFNTRSRNFMIWWLSSAAAAPATPATCHAVVVLCFRVIGDVGWMRVLNQNSILPRRSARDTSFAALVKYRASYVRTGIILVHDNSILVWYRNRALRIGRANYSGPKRCIARAVPEYWCTDEMMLLWSKFLPAGSLIRRKSQLKSQLGPEPNAVAKCNPCMRVCSSH